MRRAKARSAPLIVLVGIAVLVAAGCGSDEEGEETSTEPGTTTAPTIAAPATTAPPPAAAPPTTAPAKPTPAPEPEPAAPTPAPNPCTTDRAISNLKFTGIPCAQAAAVADEWNERIDECNTIDDPSSPQGYNRTCTVQAYTCRAKRDTKSDARFVACAKGAATIRFTWAPP
jgi:hypothetical protein